MTERLGPDVMFVSDPVRRPWTESLSADGDLRLSGTLALAGRYRKLTVPVMVREGRVEARFTLSFEALGLSPPSMGPFGVGGRVHDAFEISVVAKAEPLLTTLAKSEAPER